MGFESEELVELCPRLETQTATATFNVSPVVQVINQIAVVIGTGHILQAASNFAGAAALRL